MTHLIELTQTTIDVQKILQAVAAKGAGAQNVFIGAVRDNTKGKKVMRLEYEAYDVMAIAEIKNIFDAAALKWSLIAVAISHRTGVLLPGEAAVVLALSTPHRQDAFDATQFIMNELKQTVPIWKKEIFEDGEVWVSAHP